MLYIGIDSGTQSTKSIVVDLPSGGLVASAQESYGLIPGLPPGHMEQDPKVWADAVDHTIQQCLAQLGDRKHDVRAIGVSGQQHGLVALNGADEVIRPAQLPELLEQAVKLSEGSRAEPSVTAVELHQAIYGRFKGLTQTLAAGGFL
jgi:sugar (pentulose or hexulose) kinase